MFNQSSGQVFDIKSYFHSWKRPGFYLHKRGLRLPNFPEKNIQFWLPKYTAGKAPQALLKKFPLASRLQLNCGRPFGSFVICKSTTAPLHLRM